MSGDQMESLDKDWSNYWQGRTANAEGSALVGIENHAAILSLWKDAFNGLDRSIKALDMACGAGTVAKVLVAEGFTNVSGLDISESAIEIMSNTLPSVSGFVNPAESTSFKDSEFDLIVSQYGFEYGNYETVIPEIVRILKPSGTFFALTHKTGGGIHKEVSQQYDEILAIKTSGFNDAAKGLFSAAMTNEPRETPEDVGKLFRPAQSKLLKLAKSNKGLAEYLYVSAQRMFNQRNKYYLKDVLTWFDGMEEEVERFLGRMRSMKEASVDSQKLENMTDLFANSGLKMNPTRTLKDDLDEELGWVLSGVKRP